MNIKILYEDDNIIAIDKPSGVVVDEVLARFPDSVLGHRLDQGTSGVMLLAKNESAHEFLKNQFKSRTIKKVYHCLVRGSVKNDYGIINKPIGRSPRDFRRRLAGRGARGEMREAITEYKVLKRFNATASEIFSSYDHPSGGSLGAKKFQKPPPEKFSFLEVRPKTGRTHQIRVHLKYLNHPIVGDKLYNPKDKSGGRIMLHASSIEFKNLEGKNIKLEALLPEEFKSVIN